MGVFDTLIDSLLGNPDLGVDIVYTPQSGSAVPCRGVWAQPDIEAQLGQARIRDRKRDLLVRQADIAAPEKNAAVTIGGADYRLADFSANDPLRLTWKFVLAAQP